MALRLRNLRSVVLITAVFASTTPPLFERADASSGAEYPLSSVIGGDRYFSPDGDDQDDTLDVSYYLQTAARVGWTVTDSGGTVVKSSAPADLTTGWRDVVLDGTSDAGTLANGAYTLTITATTGSDVSGTTLVDFGVTRGPIATLTSPATGDVISGNAVPVSLTLGAGLPAGGHYNSASMTATSNGDSSSVSGYLTATTGTMDTSYATDGINLLSANVYWTDPLGASHTYLTPGISVTVDNPMRLTSSPNNHWVVVGSEPSDIGYTLSRAGTVTVTVRNGDGDPVATPVNAVDRPAGWNDESWNLTDTGGNPVPEGVYDVGIHAVDAKDRSADASFKLGVWRHGVGSVSASPANPVSGSLTATYDPSLPDGSAVSSVSFGGDSTDGTNSLYLPYDGDGAPWTSTTNTTPQWSTYSGYYGGAPDGDYGLTADVSWTDGFGANHYTVSDPTPVTIANDVQVHSAAYNDGWVTPDVSGNLGSWSGYILRSESDAPLTAIVEDSDGDQVDTATTDNDTGQVTWSPQAGIADGVYTVVSTATDTTSGHTATATSRVGVDTRSPGTLTPPGVAVAGTDITFTPAAGITPSYVTLYRDDGQYVGNAQPDEDGVWHYTLAASNVPPAGDHVLYAEVSVPESFGQATLYSATVPFSADNSGRITDLSIYSNKWFNPTLGDSQYVRYTLDSPGTVTIDLLDDQQDLAATLASEVAAAGGDNYFSWDGDDAGGNPVPSGTYDLRVTSTGDDGTTTSMTKQVTIERGTPGAITLPAEGDVLSGSVGYEFTPTAGYGVSAINFCIVQSSYPYTSACRAANTADDDGAFRANQSLTHVSQGAYTVYAVVKSTDPYGQNHTWTSGSIPVEVKALQLPLSVTAPASGPAPLDATISFKTSHPDDVSLSYDVDFGDQSAHQTGTVESPYPIVTVPHTYTSRGNFPATVTVSDSDGHTTTRTVTVSVTNRPPTGSMGVAPLKVVVGSPVTASLSGSDPDNDPLTYGITWGDGGSAQQPLTGGSATATHTYTAPGTYSISYVLGDGYVQGGVRAGTATVVVQSDQPPVADPGPPPTRALATVPVLFDGSASTPSDGITAYHWDFGDGSTADTASPTHTYGDEGAYTATLTVHVGDRTDSASIPIAVGPKPAGDGVKVTVTGGGAVLPGALVTYFDPDGSKQQTKTDSSGIATIHGLPDGDYAFYAWKDPYRPGTGTGTVTNDNGHVTIDLVNGDLGAVTLESHKMSMEEIKAAGIDPDDPANQYVFSFNIRLSFSVQPDQPPQQQDFKGFANTDGFVGETGYTGAQQACRGVCPLDLGDGYQATPQPDFSNPDKPTIVWLVMPVKGSMLKEFFDVQMVVTNLSPGFTMEGGVAQLTLDHGLSLAPIAQPQSLTVTACTDTVTTNCMPDIPGGASQRVRWVVRGDEAGDHPISARYDASLEPVGAPVHLVTKPASLKVWGATGLQFIVHVQDQAYENLPYDVTVEVKNITPDTTFYNVGLELQSGQHYVFAPGLSPKQQTDVLAPGRIWNAQWQVIPDLTGQLDLSQAVVERVTGGQPTQPDKVVTDPANNTPEKTPQLHAVADGDNVDLNWTAIKGASDYRIYATDDLGHGFVSDPLSELAGTSVTVPRYAPANNEARRYAPKRFKAADASGGGTLHYAVMTVTDGRAALRHNIADVLDGFSCPSKDTPGPAVKAGPWSLTGCVKHVSGPGVTAAGDDDVWVARQQARLNGIDLTPTTATGEVRFNLTKQTLSASSPIRASLALPDVAGVSIPPITLFEAQPAWDLSANTVPITLSTPRLLGLPVAASATIDATDDAASNLDVTVTPPAVLGGKPSQAKLHSDNAGGLHLDSIDVDIANPTVGTLIGLDKAHLTYDGTQWTLAASGAGGATVDGTLTYATDGTLQTGHLVVHHTSIAGLFTLDTLTLDATSGEHWTGTANASLSDGSTVNVGFDLAYSNGKLTAATVTAPRLLLKGLFEVTAAKLTWTSASSTWAITGTASTPGATPTTLSGTLTVVDGAITRGDLDVDSLAIGGLATLTKLVLHYSAATSAWSGDAALALPGSTTPALHLALSVVGGVLQSAHADVGRATVAGLLTTTNATFDYVAEPGRWQVAADDASLGNLVAVKNLLVANDVGAATWQLSGKVDTAGSTATVDAALTYDKGALASGKLDLSDVHLGGLVDIDSATLNYDAPTATWAASAAAGDAAMDFTVINGVVQSGHVKVPNAKIAGVIDVTDFAVDYDAGSGQWGGGGTAAIPGADASKISVSFAYADGTLVGGSLTGNASFMNALRIDDISLGYDKSADRWSGGAKITLPGPGGAKVGGTFVFEHGQFVSGSATADGLDIPLGSGLALRRINFDVDTKPDLKLEGQARIAAPQVPGLNKDAVSVDGDMSYTFSDPGQWHVAGTFNLVDFPLAHAHLDYLTSGKASFGGDLDAGLSGVAEIKAGLSGGVGGDGISASGDASVSVLKLVGLSGKVLVDNHGIAGCGQLHVGWTWDAGVVYPWGGTARALGGSCDLSSWEAANAAVSPSADSPRRVPAARRLAADAAADVPSTVAVPSGASVFALAFTGASAPSVTLTDPNGDSYAATDGVFDAPGNGYAVTRDATTTYFLLNQPVGGNWTVTVDDGSAPVTGVQQAQGLPDPNVAASVTGSGSERTLHWSLDPIPGQTVTFVAADGATSQQLITTSDPSGSTQFTPAPGPAGTRTVHAVVSQNGFPRKEIAALATFDVADSTPVALTVTRDGTGQGSVTSQPSGIDCGSNCTTLLAKGGTATLTAAPVNGSTFAGWGGACSGTDSTCQLTLDGDRQVTASFTTGGAPGSPGGGGGAGTPTSTPTTTTSTLPTSTSTPTPTSTGTPSGSPTPTPTSSGSTTPSPTSTPTEAADVALTIAGARHSVAGHWVALGGSLHRHGSPVGGQRVMLWRSTGHGWKQIGTVTTDASGRWHAVRHPRVTTSYLAAAVVPPGTTWVKSAVWRVGVHAAVSWRPEVRRIEATTRHVRLAGVVRPGRDHDAVTLYRARRHGGWGIVDTDRLNDRSRFGFSVVAHRHPAVYRVRIGPGTTTLAGRTPPLRLKRS